LAFCRIKFVILIQQLVETYSTQTISSAAFNNMTVSQGRRRQKHRSHRMFTRE